MGDVISSASSHQAVLIHLLDDFVSSKGLRVKVWERGEGTAFPGGFEFHRSPSYMKQFLHDRQKPYIFHMSWTDGSKTKKKFMEQLGEWYCKEDKSQCYGSSCCLAQPNITCHFRDKPSKIPCNQSPSMVRNGKPFW
jgi:hypothetical protein